MLELLRDNAREIMIHLLTLIMGIGIGGAITDKIYREEPKEKQKKTETKNGADDII